MTYLSLKFNLDIFCKFQRKICYEDNVNHNLSKWFCGINIIHVVSWSQSV